MASAAELSQGSTFAWGSATIAEVTSIGKIGIKNNAQEVTSHDTSNNSDDWIGGQVIGGELPISGNFVSGDTSGQIQLFADCAAGTKKVITITLANTAASTWVATGLCTEVNVDPADLKGIIKFDAKFKISGLPVFTV
jgi:hypothetical protein